MPKTIKLRLLGLILLCAGSLSGFPDNPPQTNPPQTNPPQTNPPPEASKSLKAETASALQDQRDRLNQEIREIEDTLRDLDNYAYWLQQEQRVENDLEKKKKGKPAFTELDNRLGQIKKGKGWPSGVDTETALATQTEVANVAGERKKALQEKMNLKEKIEDEINSRINIEKPKQDFKTLMSGIFAFLVALVIIGFFVIAWRDPQVGREIFEGGDGIHFVRLFSLVIAIILFGITGIFE